MSKLKKVAKKAKSKVKGNSLQGVAANGTKIRKKDSTYFDTQASRKRANKWQATKLFRYSHIILGAFTFVATWALMDILTLLVVTVANNFSMSFGNHIPIYSQWGIPFLGNPIKSVLIWGMFKWWNLLVPLIAALVLGIMLGLYNKRIQSSNTDEDINEYEGDASVMTIPELVLKYKAMPDQGAHSHSINANGLVSHIPLSNKGVKPQMMPVLEWVGGDSWGKAKARRVVTEEYIDERTGKKKIRNKVAKQKLIDEEDALRQLKNVGMKDKQYLNLEDPSKLIFNEEKHKTLADFINQDWWMPDYETQKPSGAYLVDESAINTLVVAMTRGNKGQSIINPMIDMWSRQDKKQNIFCNDPKGELYTGFMATLKLRGYDTVVFNLLDPSFTDKYNPLAEAVNYARKGYRDEPQKVLTNLTDNFFPIPKGGDPFWTKAERTLFSMLALALMDIYYEEEQEYLQNHQDTDPVIVANYIDELWSHVTLANVYRMVSALATHKYQPHDINGKVSVDKDTGEELPETDKNMLEMLFELTNELPSSNLRQLFSFPYSNFMTMADSDKMRASIYGLTLTEMGLFSEGPIMALTDASPKESFDLVSMSFPRRFQFKFNQDFIDEFGLLAQAVDFEMYKDPYFKEKYEGKDYEHSTRIDAQSWVEMRFAAILPKPVTYVKIIVRPRGVKTDTVYSTFYAMFTKGYQKTPDGNFVKDKITGDWVIRDGVLRVGQLGKDGKFRWGTKKEPTKYQPKFASPKTGEMKPVFDLTEVSYIERPLAVFSVTPPSALVYVKIVLMLMHSMFNSNVENSYMTKENGKPLLETKYMLDELGNLAYDGSGIAALTTKLSIGLAQGQMYTLVFQTLQQIKDVYGETADRIISGNTGLTTFLLSNDLDMLETLSKQAGMVHRGRKNSKNFTQHVGTMMDLVEDSVSYTMTVSEEPLFSVSRLLEMTNGEALMLSSTKRQNNDGSNARQQPVFNTKSTSLPMAWSLHKYGYGQRSYSMATVPTASTSLGQDAKIPPFEAIIYKRALQAALAKQVKEKYMEDHNLSEIEFGMLDPNVVGRELMAQINDMVKIASSNGTEKEALQRESAEFDVTDQDIPEEDLDDNFDDDDFDDFDASMESFSDDIDDSLDADDEEIQESLNKAASSTSGADFSGTAFKASEGLNDAKNVKLHDVKDDDSVKAEYISKKREQDAINEKVIFNGKFSQADIELPMFKAIISDAMSMFPRRGTPGFEMTNLNNDGVETKLLYQGNVLAIQRVVEQVQKSTIDDSGLDDFDGGIDVGGEQSKTVRGASWDIEPMFMELLKQNDIWFKLPRIFTDLVVREFTKQSTGKDDGSMRV